MSHPEIAHPRAADHGSAHSARSARNLRKAGARRTGTLCPVCGKGVGLDSELVEHLDSGCRTGVLPAKAGRG